MLMSQSRTRLQDAGARHRERSPILRGRSPDLSSSHGDAPRRGVQVPVRPVRSMRGRVARGGTSALAPPGSGLGADPAHWGQRGGGSEQAPGRRAVRRRPARGGVGGRTSSVPGGAYRVSVERRRRHAGPRARVRAAAVGYAAASGGDSTRGHAAGTAAGGVRRRDPVEGGGRLRAAARPAAGGGSAPGTVPATGVCAA